MANKVNPVKYIPSIPSAAQFEAYEKVRQFLIRNEACTYLMVNDINLSEEDFEVFVDKILEFEPQISRNDIEDAYYFLEEDGVITNLNN